MKRQLLLLLLLLGTKICAQNPDSLTFAVLGNSISTYYDYIPSGYGVYFGQDMEKSRGIQVGDTWWMQLSRLSGLTFLANASWSGSRVSCDELNSNSPFLSNHRMKALGRAGNPDFIFIAGGTNDWGWGRCDLGVYSTDTFTDSITFRGAYALLLYKLKKWYPDAKVVCLSLFPRGGGLDQKNGRGWTPRDANTSIKYIAEQFGDYYIDCSTVAWSSDWGKYTIDQLHPTTAGSTLLAQHIANQLVSKKIVTRDLRRNNEVDEAERLLDLHFTEEGIVNDGTYETRVGKHGSVATFYDSANDTYYGCTKAKAQDYFYATYDADSPLAEAFNSSVTWEVLVRLDALGDHGGNINRTCFLGNEENGGWAFYNSSLASCFSYQNQSGVKSSVKSITGDSILIPGKFYHLVVTMDRMSHFIRYYVNGKLVCTGTRAGTDMTIPQCGSPKGKKNIWICLGGDATGGSFTNNAENSSACSFVFARIYDGALTQKSALKLYDDDVKRFTEPRAPLGTEHILDCEFTPEGAINHAPSYRDRPIVMNGDVPISYNADINQYITSFNKTKSEFFKYFLGDDLPIMSQLSDAYSVEVLCKSSDALPSSSIRPIGFINGYGFGLQMNNRGDISYTTTTQGIKSDNSYGKTQWSWVGAGTLTDEYTHYVIVYDRLNNSSRFYINGELKATRQLTFKECPVYEWTPSTWLAIGGDASGNYSASTSTGSYPFMGDVALVRIYGKALTQSQIEELVGIQSSQERSFTLGSNGYVAVCLPYIYQVPEGCTAYIVTEIASPSVMLMPIAQAGEAVPYGTPVIIKGTPKATITLTAQDKSKYETDEEYLLPVWKENLLAGTYTGKTLSANEGFYLRTTGSCLYRATAAVSLSPFSSYLPSLEKRSTFNFAEIETPDGIVSPKSSSEGKGAEGIYDLSGRRVTTPNKGVYIQNGKKVLK